jgi:hypothetical protein
LDEAAFVWQFCWAGLRGAFDEPTHADPEEQR